VLKRTAVLGTIAVGVHAVIVFLHGQAHGDLGVELNRFQQVFAGVVIVVTSLVAAALLWSRYQSIGCHLPIEKDGGGSCNAHSAPELRRTPYK